MTIQLAKQSTLQQFRDLIRVGFELETQSISGKNWRALNSVSVPVTRTRTREKTDIAEYRSSMDLHQENAIRANASEITKKIGLKLRKLYRENSDVRDLKISVFSSYYERHSLKTFSECVNNYSRSRPFDFYDNTPDRVLLELIAQTRANPALCAKIKAIYAYLRRLQLDRVVSQLPVIQSETVTEEYTENQSIPFDQYMTDHLHIPADLLRDLAWKPDGSVDGPEITTMGPQTLNQASAHALALFTALSSAQFTVDTGCSFHIHASIIDSKPKHSKLFQAFLMREILNDPRVPASVRTRWKTDSLNRYFNFELDDQKYRFVAYRGNTWEFRCFGNIDNSADAILCLNIVTEAYHKAITRPVLELSLPIGTSFQRIALHAARNGMTYTESYNALVTADQSEAA